MRRRWPYDVALLGVLAVFVLPLLWLVFAAFDRSADLRVRPPSHPTFANFKAVLNVDTTYRPMLNGLELCGSATLLTVASATLAAYPLSRHRFRLRRPLLLTILFTAGLPITAIMVPVYAMFVQVNLIDTMSGTILFLAATSLPFAIWMLKGFMDDIPRELEEATQTDGASMLQTLWGVVLPLARPGIVAVTLFTFIGMWGDFFVPFVLLLSPDQLPASVSIFYFFDQHGQVQYGQLAAFSVLYSAPVLVLYLALGRRISSGFQLSGAFKG